MALNGINVLFVANVLKVANGLIQKQYGLNTPKANKLIGSLHQNMVALPKQFKEN